MSEHERIRFKGPPERYKQPAIMHFLELCGLLDTMAIAWLVFTDSIQDKGILQGCQAALTKLVKKGKVSMFPGARLEGFGYRRNVYHPRNVLPGIEAAHRLIINKVRIAFLLIKRLAYPFKEIFINEAEYRYVRRNRRTLPATTERMSDGSTMIPDLTIFGRLNSGKDILILVECDNSTEPILCHRPESEVNSYDVTDYAGLHPSCLVYKVGRIEEFRNSPDLYNHYDEEGRLNSIIAPFVFQSERRMRLFIAKTLDHYGRNMPFICTTTRQQIEDPRDFWTRNIWHKVSVDSQPFALLEGEEMVAVPLP